MLILVAGLLVLLCVSTVQVAWNYYRGVSPLDLPSTMQKYVRDNTMYDLGKYGGMLFESTTNLLIIIAYPLTYILCTIGYYIYKLYSTIKSK